MRKIRNKILFTMMLLTLLPMILVGGYSYHTTTEALRDAALKDQQHHLAGKQQQLENILANAKRDVIFLSKASALQRFLLDKEKLPELADTFQQFAKQYPVYSSVRLLDASGQELVRADSLEGTVSLSESTDLLDQSQASYFTEASTLASGDIYISPLGLKRLNGKIVEPHQSTMTYASAVYDSQDVMNGVLVLTLNTDALIAQAALTSGQTWRTLFSDVEGYLYYHDDVEKRWGGPNDLDHQVSIFTDNSFGLFAVKGSKTQLSSESETDVSLSLPISLGEDERVLGYLVNVAPKAILFKPLRDYLSVSLIIVTICLFLSFLFAIILSNSLSEPLVKLTEKVKNFSQGDLDTPIEISGSHEISNLSQAMELLRKSMVILMKRSRKV